MRKVNVTLTVNVLLSLDDDVTVTEAVNELNYNFSGADNCDVLDTEIVDFTVTDSR